MTEHQPLALRLPTPGCYADPDRSGLAADDVFDGMTEHLFYTLGKLAPTASRHDLYMALSYAVRDRLIADDNALTRWLEQDPAADVQHLRALIRQARKDAQAITERPGEALRHGKAYREIFQIVRTALTPADESADGADDTQED